MEQKQMTILGEPVPVASGDVDIYKLKFLRDNPRVYACTHGEAAFDDLTEQEQQDLIFAKLLQEPSVKNLIPEVKRHRGLIEPVFVRNDTMEVIEGNSRLAVYRHLDQRKEEGDWGRIPCELVSSLTEDQQSAFLNQVHVKGKTKWSAYEKANFAYVRQERGWSLRKIAELFGESIGTIRTRTKVVQLMKDNDDSQRGHFSYYDVLIRNTAIDDAVKKDQTLRTCLLQMLKGFGSDEHKNDFTAQELRAKLPVVANKPKVLKRFVAGKVQLDEAYRLATVSQVEGRLKQACDILDDVAGRDILDLDGARFNAVRQAFRKLSKHVDRIANMVKQAEDDD